MNLNAIKDAANIYLYEKLSTGEDFFAYSDYANSVSVEVTAENVKAKKKGNDCISFDYGKKGTFKISMEVFTKSMLELLVGQRAVVGNHNYIKREVLSTNASNSVTITGTPNIGTLIFGLTTDGYTFSKKLNAGIATTVGQYGITGKVITCNVADAPEGTKVMAIYIEQGTDLEKLTINANVFAKGFRCYFDTSMKGDDQVERMIQVELPNIKPKSNITLDFNAESVAKIEINADILVDDNDDMVNILFLE
jgi:hypothetical protein